MIAQRFDVVPRMTADAARSAVDAINSHMHSARALLYDLYEQHGWAALGYSSWRECVTSEFDVSATHLYRQLQAAEIERRVSPIGDIGAIPESHLRPLITVAPDKQADVWDDAQSIARDRHERFSSRHVAAAIQEHHASLQHETEDMTDRSAKFNDGMRSSDSPEWYTPREIIDRVIAVFGTIDLDPCSSADAQRTVRAARYYTQQDDGLTLEWHGNVYINPPYGDAIVPWIPRMVAAYTSSEITAAIALLPGRTETDWFAPLFSYPICFVHGRLRFSGSKNSAPFPSVIIYLGPNLGAFRDSFQSIGPIMVPLTHSIKAS